MIVATNALIDYDVVHFDLSGCGGAAAEALLEVYRTSVKEDCQRVVSVTVPTPLRFGCPLRPLSITTFVVTFQAPDKSLSDDLSEPREEHELLHGPGVIDKLRDYVQHFSMFVPVFDLCGVKADDQ